MAVDQFGVLNVTVVVANVSGYKNWCSGEEPPDGCPVMDICEQLRHRNLSSRQLEDGDPGGDHDEHNGESDRYSRRESQ
jgi:hypothetical protein